MAKLVKPKFTDEQINEWCDRITSYADGHSKVMRDSGMDIDELVEFMLDHGIEQCPGCRWWCETSELVDSDDEPDGYCENCRPHRAQ